MLHRVFLRSLARRPSLLYPSAAAHPADQLHKLAPVASTAHYCCATMQDPDATLQAAPDPTAPTANNSNINNQQAVPNPPTAPPEQQQQRRRTTRQAPGRVKFGPNGPYLPRPSLPRPQPRHRPQQQLQQQQQRPGPVTPSTSRGDAAASSVTTAASSLQSSNTPSGQQQQQQSGSVQAAVPSAGGPRAAAAAAFGRPRPPGRRPRTAAAQHLPAAQSAAAAQQQGAPQPLPAGQLSVLEMQQLADRNHAAAEAAAAAAAAAGQPPQLLSLLTEPSWRGVLGPQFDAPSMRQLQDFVQGEWARHRVFPPPASIFRALNSVPLDQVRVVILGQDPYHGEGEAMGLSFSVPHGVKVPSSLSNIYKELAADLGVARPSHGCLQKWCNQGVLLLNAVLTVREDSANSHAGQGWEGLTSAALQALVQQRSGVVFMLWGKNAQARCDGLDMRRHHVLATSHPSGLSAHRGFLGSRHFSAANALLQQSGWAPIDWQID